MKYSVQLNLELTEEEIIKHADQIDWPNFIANNHPHNFSIEFFKRVKTLMSFLDWWALSQRYVLSEEFIETFQDRLSWDHICFNQNLSVEFIVKHKNKIDWDSLACNTRIPDSVKLHFQKDFESVGIINPCG